MLLVAENNAHPIHGIRCKMQLIRDLFGLSGPEQEHSETTSDSIQEITKKLVRLPPEKACHIAAFAYLLGRVAHADLEITSEETMAMEQTVVAHGGLSPEEATIVVQIAQVQNLLFGGTENYLVSREFKKMTQLPERISLLKCLFAVSASDDAISLAEDNEIGKISRELGISHKEFIRTRLAFREHLTILRGSPG